MHIKDTGANTARMLAADENIASLLLGPSEGRMGTEREYEEEEAATADNLATADSQHQELYTRSMRGIE